MVVHDPKSRDQRWSGYWVKTPFLPIFGTVHMVNMASFKSNCISS
jgi:hypothetical protein